MKLGIFTSVLLLAFKSFSTSEEAITPHKFGDEGMPCYAIPSSSRFTIKRLEEDAPPLVYYMSSPRRSSYPIAILCGGSSSPESLSSIIHFHRYFLKEFLGLGVGVLTVEQRGIDGAVINKEEFMEYYTRSERLKDHQLIIGSLQRSPPLGWNGKFIFLGVSEGGHLVTTLSTQYAECLIATINWCGAGDWSWKDEIWVFLQKLWNDNPECLRHKVKIKDCSICSTHITERSAYDARMDSILERPVADKYFFNMTYKYHADALTYPAIDYAKIRTPFLVVAGDGDSLIHSSDAFVEKAQKAAAPVTYFRIEGMDHYVRKRPDVIVRSFEWLHAYL